ncbi:MAG: hypothetical protein ACR2KG_01120 [Nocardioidaceae bacterium]
MKITTPLAGVAALGLALAVPAITAAASADSGSTYQATLSQQNHSGASGTFMLTLNGSQATITEHVTGLASTFNGAPYPHVQHIHINGQHMCPTPSADKNADGVVNTTEGAPAYGPIGTTLSVSGGTAASDGTDVTIAPSGSSFDYSRTITLDAATMSQVTAGNAVIVVHGLDPTTLSKKAQGEKSDLVPSLPLAATSPALCGPLVASQMGSMPSGGAQTGDGGSVSGTNVALATVGGMALFVSGGMLIWRRRVDARS